METSKIWYEFWTCSTKKFEIFEIFCTQRAQFDRRCRILDGMLLDWVCYFDFLDWYFNKTPGYLGDVFRPLTLLKNGFFEGWKPYFWGNQILKFSQLSQNLDLDWEKDIFKR